MQMARIIDDAAQFHRIGRLVTVNVPGYAGPRINRWAKQVFYLGEKFQVWLQFVNSDGTRIPISFMAYPPAPTSRPDFSKRCGTVVQLEGQHELDATTPMCFLSLSLHEHEEVDADPSLHFTLWQAYGVSRLTLFLVVNPLDTLGEVLTDTFRLGPSAQWIIMGIILSNPDFDVNAKDRFGATPLINACGVCPAVVIDLLLKFDILDARMEDRFGYTALHTLARRAEEGDHEMEIAFLRLLQHASLVDAPPEYDAYIEAVEQASCDPRATLRYVEMLTPGHKMLTKDLLLNATGNLQLLRLVLQAPRKGLSTAMVQQVLEVVCFEANTEAREIIMECGHPMSKKTKDIAWMARIMSAMAGK